LLLVDTHALIK